MPVAPADVVPSTAVPSPRTRPQASTDRHQARIAAGGRRVDAERALDHQPLQRHVVLPGIERDHADDRPGALGHAPAQRQARRGIAVVQHRIEMHRVADQSCASATARAPRPAGARPARRGRPARARGCPRPAPPPAAPGGRPRRRPGTARVSRGSTAVDIRFAGRAGQRARTPAGECASERSHAGGQSCSRPCAGAQSRSACSGAIVGGARLRRRTAQRRRLAAAERSAGSAASSGRCASRRSRYSGPPAFGPVPDSPSPPKGCTPTTAPTMLRLT